MSVRFCEDQITGATCLTVYIHEKIEWHLTSRVQVEELIQALAEHDDGWVEVWPISVKTGPKDRKTLLTELQDALEECRWADDPEHSAG